MYLSVTGTNPVPIGSSINGRCMKLIRMKDSALLLQDRIRYSSRPVTSMTFSTPQHNRKMPKPPVNGMKSVMPGSPGTPITMSVRKTPPTTADNTVWLPIWQTTVPPVIMPTTSGPTMTAVKFINPWFLLMVSTTVLLIH